MAPWKDSEHKLCVQAGRSQKDCNSNSIWKRRMSRIWKINTSKGLCLSQSQTSSKKASFAFAQTAKCTTISFPKLINQKEGKTDLPSNALKIHLHAGACLDCTGIMGMRWCRAGAAAPEDTTLGKPHGANPQPQLPRKLSTKCSVTAGGTD